MRKLMTVAYEIFGPKSLLQKVEISDQLGEESFSDMLDEEDEMIAYTARQKKLEKLRIKKMKEEQARKNKEEEAKKKLQENDKISRQELAKHFSKHDAWIAIHGKVYDVTKYVSRHPGGSIIL